jgi:hypothetical protein
MTTADGRLVTEYNLGVPTPRDLATSLGRMPRFAGHTRVWWTVLHHVALVYRLLERHHGALPADGFKLHVLLHDSEESILCDLPTPWKTDERRVQEERLCARFRRAYGEPQNADQLAAWESEVKRADAAALRVECTRVGPPGVEQHSGLAYLADRDPLLSKNAGLACTEVMAMKHDPFEPAESELGSWYLRALEAAVGSPSRWKLLCQVAP